MKNRALACAVLLFPVLAGADTLTMKNGTRFVGTFNSANANQISFTESNGNRQSLNTYDVQELRFGNDSNQPNNTGFGRDSQRDSQNPYPNQPAPNNRYPNQSNQNRPYSNQTQSSTNASPANDLERLQSDLQSAMGNNNLYDDQRQSLQDSSAVLTTASQQARNNRPLNQRAVRLALDSIRNAANTFSQQDRDNLSDDIRRVNAAVNNSAPNNGRDY